MAENMMDILAGNFDSVKKPIKQNNSSLATDDSVMDGNRYRNYEEPMERKPKLPFGKEPFQGRLHEDD